MKYISTFLFSVVFYFSANSQRNIYAEKVIVHDIFRLANVEVNGIDTTSNFTTSDNKKLVTRKAIKDWVDKRIDTLITNQSTVYVLPDIADTSTIIAPKTSDIVWISTTQIAIRSPEQWLVLSLEPDGNGIISALPAGPTTIDADGNSFFIDDLNTLRYRVRGNTSNAGEFRLSNETQVTTAQIKADQVNVFPNPESTVGETAPIFKMYEGNTAFATDYIGLKAPESVTNAITYTLPEAGKNGDQLHVSGGKMYWRKLDTTIVLKDLPDSIYTIVLDTSIQRYSIVFNYEANGATASAIGNFVDGQTVLDISTLAENIADTVFVKIEYIGDKWHRINFEKYTPPVYTENEIPYALNSGVLATTPAFRFGNGFPKRRVLVGDINNVDPVFNGTFAFEGLNNTNAGIQCFRNFGSGQGTSALTGDGVTSFAYNKIALTQNFYYRGTQGINAAFKLQNYVSNGTPAAPTSCIDGQLLYAIETTPRLNGYTNSQAATTVTAGLSFRLDENIADINNRGTKISLSATKKNTSDVVDFLSVGGSGGVRLFNLQTESGLNSMLTYSPTNQNVHQNNTIKAGNERVLIDTDTFSLVVGTTERIKGALNKLEINATGLGLCVKNMNSSFLQSDKIMVVSGAESTVKSRTLGSAIFTGNTNASGQVTINTLPFQIGTQAHLLIQGVGTSGRFDYGVLTTGAATQSNVVVQVYLNGAAVAANTAVSFIYFVHGD